MSATIRIKVALLFALIAVSARAQDSLYVPSSFTEQLLNSPPCLTIRQPWEGENIPCTPYTHQEWLNDLTHWRTERRIRIGYDPARYQLPALQWTQSSFIQPQMMVQDRYFYDPVAGNIPSTAISMTWTSAMAESMRVLVWATYPNMGIDDRNQHGYGALHARRRRRACGRWSRISIVAACACCSR